MPEATRSRTELETMLALRRVPLFEGLAPEDLQRLLLGMARNKVAFEARKQRAQRRDGPWPTYSPYPGRQWFQLEPPGPSRWNTCRVLRVLQWWDS